MEVRVHPQVKRYLDDSGEKERIKESLKKSWGGSFHIKERRRQQEVEREVSRPLSAEGWRAQV